MKQLIPFTLFFLISFISFSQEITTTSTYGRHIEVIGEAEQEIIPDEIYLKILIKEKDTKGKEKLEELEQKMMNKLKELGINLENDVSISDFSSNFKFYWIKKTDVFTNREYQVLARDTKTVGKIIRELEQLNISNISVDKVDHSKIETFKKELKIKAVQAAKDKAIYLTAAIDQKIGPAIYIGEWNDESIQTQLAGRLAGANIRIRGNSMGKRKGEANVEFEKIKLRSKIQAKFELLGE